MDIIEEARNKKYEQEKKYLKKAKNRDEDITLYLERLGMFSYQVWCAVGWETALKTFGTEKGASNYFDMIMKKYNLELVDE